MLAHSHDWRPRPGRGCLRLAQGWRVAGVERQGHGGQSTAGGCAGGWLRGEKEWPEGVGTWAGKGRTLSHRRARHRPYNKGV